MGMYIPNEYILAALTGLSGVISCLAGLLWALMKARIEKQDTIIAGLQNEIATLSKGCGIQNCIWKRGA